MISLHMLVGMDSELEQIGFDKSWEGRDVCVWAPKCGGWRAKIIF